jgi:hypothetical protein
MVVVARCMERWGWKRTRMNDLIAIYVCPCRQLPHLHKLRALSSVVLSSRLQVCLVVRANPSRTQLCFQIFG